jgi:heat-inducible transcriptional repressor
MSLNQVAIGELTERSREILRTVVEAYVETGEPVGSRTISRKLGLTLSPATIRNVMADLEECGLLYAPHTSAGRLPTELGLRLFVHGLLEIGSLTQEERASIDGQCRAAGKSLAEVLEEATEMLSGLSHCAGLVVAPKVERPLKHIEFVQIGPARALVVLVAEGGLVENRIVDLPVAMPPSSLVEAGNYLTQRLVGRTLSEARAQILNELEASRAELDQLTGKLVEQGLAIWGGVQAGAVIVKGQSRLLEDVTALSDLERVRALLAALDARDSMVKLLDATQGADGVQIYIGAENELFSLAGCSVVFAPYRDGRERIVGAIGVVGPTRMNYARIIPMVDYTAKVIGRIIG